MAKLVCPSCGAPIPEELRFETTYHCEFCGNTAYFEHETEQGKAPGSAALADFYTRFALGQTGSIRNNPFSITGRVQFEYEDGFWTEWLLVSGQDQVWLHEDEGVYVLFNKREIVEQLPPLAVFVPGASVEWNRMPRWFITEVRTAKVIAVEGSVPEPRAKGQEILYVDGLSGGRVASLDMNPDGSSPRLTVGIPLEYEEINIEGEEQPNW